MSQCVGRPATGDVLHAILQRKAEEVAARRGRLPLRELRQRAADASPPRGFAADLAAGEHRHVRVVERLLARAAA